jgi:hypothetical protein|tara:strand:+ start:311 stop:487 length:177 start_codon:yes stop_codon:yes gene_type:complete
MGEKQQTFNHSEKTASKVDLNLLIKKVKEEEKKNKRTNIAVSAAAVSAIAVFGIILTL